MKKVENLLKHFPLTQPSESMDKKTEDLFDQARENARQHWYEFRVPAWGALAACIACLLIGRLWVPEPEVQQSTNPPPVVVPETQPSPAVTSESEPEVFVQITRNAGTQDSSPFVRRKKPSTNRFSTSWSVTN